MRILVRENWFLYEYDLLLIMLYNFNYMSAQVNLVFIVALMLLFLQHLLLLMIWGMD